MFSVCYPCYTRGYVLCISFDRFMYYIISFLCSSEAARLSGTSVVGDRTWKAEPPMPAERDCDPLAFSDPCFTTDQWGNRKTEPSTARTPNTKANHVTYRHQDAPSLAQP